MKLDDILVGLLPVRAGREEFMPEKVVPELFKLTGDPGGAGGIRLDGILVGLLPMREVREKFVPAKVVPELFTPTGDPGDVGGVGLDGVIVASAPTPGLPKSVTLTTNWSPIGCPINHGLGSGDPRPGLA